MKVLVKYRAPTEDPDDPFLPLFLYTEPLDVISEDEETVTIRYQDSEFYTYKIKKKYIEKTYP